MAKLQRVTFEGVYRKWAVVVKFDRQDSGDWLLTMIVNAEVHLITIPKRDRVTACWSSACDYLDLHVPSAKKPPSLRAVRQTNRQKQIARQTKRGGKLTVAEGTGRE